MRSGPLCIPLLPGIICPSAQTRANRLSCRSLPFGRGQVLLKHLRGRSSAHCCWDPMCSAGSLPIASNPGDPAIRELVALSSHLISTPLSPNLHYPTIPNGTWWPRLVARTYKITLLSFASLIFTRPLSDSPPRPASYTELLPLFELCEILGGRPFQRSYHYAVKLKLDRIPLSSTVGNPPRPPLVGPSTDVPEHSPLTLSSCLPTMTISWLGSSSRYCSRRTSKM